MSRPTAKARLVMALDALVDLEHITGISA